MSKVIQEHDLLPLPIPYYSIPKSSHTQKESSPSMRILGYFWRNITNGKVARILRG